jgi:hypothetical protein
MKKAPDAAKQIQGALRTSASKEIWCQHSRRGRVDFPDGLPKIDHGIVVVEVTQVVDLVESRPGNLPLEYQGTPIHYFSLSDFMNVAAQLRTVPEITAYLTARHSLPPEVRLCIGDENLLFSLYLLNDGSFDGCSSREAARNIVASNQEKLVSLVQKKNEVMKYCRLIERVAEEIATRDPKLPEQLQSQYEPIDKRVGYLKMQDVLTNLLFRDRVALGRTFWGRIEFLDDKPQGFTIAATSVDSLPDHVFVFASSKNSDRKILIELLSPTTHSAMAHYQKTVGFMIVDRDGQGFELGYFKTATPPTEPALIEWGKKNFGKITSTPMSFIG